MKKYEDMNDNELCEELRREQETLFGELRPISEALARLLHR